MGPRPRSALVAALFGVAASVASAGRSIAITSRQALDALFVGSPERSFSERYGSNPKATNGGTRSGAAAIKRAARRRRNVRARAPK